METKNNDSKLTMLIAGTLLLGVISVLVLFFMLMIKKQNTTIKNMPMEVKETENIVVNTSPTTEEVVPGFNVKKEVEELDKIDLEAIEKFYNPDNLILQPK